MASDVWPLAVSLPGFAVTATVIALAGWRLTSLADQIADRTGFGEALTGAVLLGAATSLGGSVLSVSAAWQGNPELAMSNALGGIAIQTAFLAIADITYQRANLEHAAASASNILQAALLVSLLALLMVASLSPRFTIAGIHPATFLLTGTYIFGLRLLRATLTDSMWQPRLTDETRLDTPMPRSEGLQLAALLVRFAVLAVVSGLAGWTLERCAAGIVAHTPMSPTVIGMLFTSASTSLPELVTSVAAVRRGALTLAVGGIIGGNAFDTLFAAASDVAYRQGSVYHAASDDVRFWIAVAILMNGFLLMGLVRRESHGIANIGFESFSILLLYAGAVALLIGT